MKRIKKISCLVLVLSAIAMILIFSNQNGMKSSSVSSTFSNVLERVCPSGINYSYVVRKSAHIFEYMILYFSIFLLLKHFKLKHKEILCFLLSLTVSIIDEYNQATIIGRSGSIKDVFIDTMLPFIITVIFYNVSNIKNHIDKNSIII